MSSVVELDHRSSAHLDVSLLWDREEGTVSIEVSDSRSGTNFTFDVPRERALDAFRHPFAYLPEAVLVA